MVRLRPDWWRRHRWQIESYERHGAAENGSEFQSRHEILLREISLCALNSFDEEHDIQMLRITSVARSCISAELCCADLC